jgi:hypothetical protein
MPGARRCTAVAAAALWALVLVPHPAAALLPPTVTSVTLSGLTSGALAPVAGTTASLTATVVVSDPDGASDINTVTVGILKPDLTVHVAQSAAVFVSSTALTATYTKALTMNYYDAAALVASTYKVKATVTDKGGASADNLAAPALFNYNQLVALSAASTFSLGSITPGSGSAIVGLAVQNAGNVQIDIQVAGTDLTSGSASIPVADLSFGTSSSLTGASTLSTTPATLTAFDLAAGSGSSRTLYLQVTTTPTGIPAGTYTGTLTLTAVSG